MEKILIMKNTIIVIFASIFSICTFAKPREINYTISNLKQNHALTEKLLFDMLILERWDIVEKLLPIYQGFEHQNPRLVNYAKIKQVQLLLQHYQYKSVRKTLQAVNSQQNLIDNERKVVKQYLELLDERDRWHFSFWGNYVYNKNINNATRERNIENTGVVKNDDMMPQSAEGIGYNFSVLRNWNLSGSHNLHFSNDVLGKFYWNNHDYDEITNRIYVGYLYRNAKIKWSIKQFYERKWFGNHRHNWANGMSLEWQKVLAKNWKLSLAGEWSQSRYFSQIERNGTIKLASATLFWQPVEKSYFYVGTDFIREQARVKQYSNDTKVLRLGWTQLLSYNIISQINGSIAERTFKDVAILGEILPLDKIRRDKIYSATLTLWKQDWHLWGFTPKVQFKYKRQKSNITSMFSYSDKNVHILVEKAF